MHEDAVQIIARLLRRDGEARAIDKAAQFRRRKSEPVRQITAIGLRKVLGRQCLQCKLRATRPQRHLSVAITGIKFNLCAVR